MKASQVSDTSSSVSSLQFQGKALSGDGPNDHLNQEQVQWDVMGYGIIVGLDEIALW